MRIYPVLMLIFMLVACTDLPPATTPVPTLTLIPVTQTPTATPIIPTATPVDLPRPDDVIADNQAVLVLAPIISTDLQPDVQLFNDMQAMLAADFEADDVVIQLASLETATWMNNQLECSQRRFPRAEQIVEGYRYILLAQERVYTFHADTEGNMRRCPGSDPVSDALLMALDPAAAELVALARSRIATELDIATRRVQMLTLRAYTWDDSSLGCPQPEQDYPTVAIDGYRILIQAGETEYLFHTDSTTLFICDPELEQLPG
ncbi:MAG: hypothetical protein ACPG7F_02240 [Aggregatilineales bacterium]